MSSDDYNPFAPPETGPESARRGDVPDDVLRREHIETEMNLKSIGCLCMVGGSIFAVAAITMGFLVAGGNKRFMTVLTISSLLLTILSFGVGIGLYNLSRTARPFAILVSAVWMIAFPFGTVIGLAALFVLFRPQASFIFSDEYRSLVARTPQVKHRTEWPTLIVGALAIGVLAFVIFALS